MSGLRSPVIVLGGGPAGCAAALRLRQLGASVRLVERKLDQPFKIGETLPPAASAHLRRLGAWERFLADGHLPSPGNLSAWGSEDLAVRDFVHDPAGPHGWHLDRARFDASLRETAREAGVEIVESDIDPWLDRNHPGRNWVIDASGRAGVFAQSRGARRRFDDRLVAVFARFTFPAGADEDSRTMIESVRDGWWYTARVPSGERLAAFLTDADLLDPELARSPDRFLEKLEASRFVRAGILRRNGRLLDVPLKTVHAQSSQRLPATGDRWLAAGDAAVAFDPIASQGILSALITGILAAETVVGAESGERSGAVRDYEERLNEIYVAYRRNHREFYGFEKRWPDSPFWVRRAAGEAAN